MPSFSPGGCETVLHSVTSKETTRLPVNLFMQIFKEEVSSALRPTLLKFSSHTTAATEEDTLLDSTSENSSAGPQMVESVNSESWSEINEHDVDNTLSSPPLCEIIQRSVVILEKHIVNVMNWREKKITRLSAVTGTAHGGISDTHKNGDVRTTSSEGGRTDNISFNPQQRKELVDYVTTIASMYKHVLYHNFEHASHVLASSDSLISMLQMNHKAVSAVGTESGSDESSVAESHHLLTFGISGSPMTHLSLILSALVHDVEHQGVGNKQLIEENDLLAIRYNGKSVAENNSLDVSLDILHKECYSNLRKCMFGDKDTASVEVKNEFDHDEKLFRNIMLNVIQATDISSQDRLEMNKAKWKRAFQDSSDSLSNCCCQTKAIRRGSLPPTFKPRANSQPRRPSLDLDNGPRPCPACNECLIHINYLRASSVLEQLIQAADVAHSMQSWPIFIKWNTKLYDELWAAKLAGRGADVSKVWFKGQIGFFDSYIMPLAKRLEECGVFGDRGPLFMENAKENRTRWLQEGEELCNEMHRRVLRMQGDISQS